MDDPVAVARVVHDGRNDMPAFGSLLTVEQIRDVTAYVVERLSSSLP